MELKNYLKKRGGRGRGGDDNYRGSGIFKYKNWGQFVLL